MPEPLSHEREQGIRLHQQMNFDPAVDVLLAEVDRLREIVAGLESQISVYERRSGLSKASVFTKAEEDTIRFALECVTEIHASRPFEFSPHEAQALKSLKEWVDGR
jgi:hypothetical protein